MAFTVRVIERDDLDASYGRTCDTCFCICFCSCSLCVCSCEIGAVADGTEAELVAAPLSPLED